MENKKKDKELKKTEEERDKFKKLYDDLFNETEHIRDLHEKRKNKNKALYLKNKDYFKNYYKKYQEKEENKKKYREYQKRYYEKNKEKILEKQRDKKKKDTNSQTIE